MPFYFCVEDVKEGIPSKPYRQMAIKDEPESSLESEEEASLSSGVQVKVENVADEIFLSGTALLTQFRYLVKAH